MRMYGEQKTVLGRCLGKLVESIATRFLGWQCVLAEPFQKDVWKSYLNWTISALACVENTQNAPSEVLKVLLTLVVQSVSIHWILYSWWKLIFTNSHLRIRIQCTYSWWRCPWRVRGCLWALQKKQKKRPIFSESASDCVLKAHLRQTSLDSCSANSACGSAGTVLAGSSSYLQTLRYVFVLGYYR